MYTVPVKEIVYVDKIVEKVVEVPKIVEKVVCVCVCVCVKASIIMCIYIHNIVAGRLYRLSRLLSVRTNIHGQAHAFIRT